MFLGVSRALSAQYVSVCASVCLFEIDKKVEKKKGLKKNTGAPEIINAPEALIAPESSEFSVAHGTRDPMRKNKMYIFFLRPQGP